MLVDAGDTTTLTRRLLTDDGAPYDAVTVIATLKAPDGTVTTLAISHPSVGVYQAPVPTPVPGDWLLTWTSTGPAQVEQVAIAALPAGSAAPWAPDLRAVGAHIPSRTRTVEGDNDPLGTFTDLTSPTGDVVASVIGSAVSIVTGMVGLPVVAAAYPLCQAAAALWAAYYVELGFPERDADVSVYSNLRADALMLCEQAEKINAAAGGGSVIPPDEDGVITGLSSFSFPPACPPPCW